MPSGRRDKAIREYYQTVGELAYLTFLDATDGDENYALEAILLYAKSHTPEKGHLNLARLQLDQPDRFARRVGRMALDDLDELKSWVEATRVSHELFGENEQHGRKPEGGS